MRNAKQTSGQMFSEVPRPWGLAGAMTIVVWLFIAIAFVTDAVPSSSSDEWLYNIEAHRAAWARELPASNGPAQVSAREVARPLRAQVAANEKTRALAN